MSVTSEDSDAVLIDTETYLRSGECSQTSSQSQVLVVKAQEKQCAPRNQPYVNGVSLLDKMYDSKDALAIAMHRQELDTSQELKAGLACSCRCYSTPEVAGLRRALTPCTSTEVSQSARTFCRPQVSQRSFPSSPGHSACAVLFISQPEAGPSSLSENSAHPGGCTKRLERAVNFSRQVRWAAVAPDVTSRRHHIGIYEEKSVQSEHNILQENGKKVQSAEGRRGHDVLTNLQKETGEQGFKRNNAVDTRRTSSASAVCSKGKHPVSQMTGMVKHEINKDHFAHSPSQTIHYDPQVEKSERYNQQRDNLFSKASQWLSPVHSGQRNLQVHYSKTNATHNDSLIFAHLLRAAHIKNAAVEEGVYALERRLHSRRHDVTQHATTFYDISYVKKASGRKSSRSCRVCSPAAKRKKERGERIQKKSKELKMVYTPTALSLRELGPDDIEAMRVQCRYLRVSHQLQEHL